MFKKPRTSGSHAINDILSCNVLPGLSANISISYDAASKFASILFPSPIRVDVYDDEFSNQSFLKDGEFAKVSENISGISSSQSSNYLREFISAEESIIESDNLVHYVIWSQSGGIAHIISRFPPKLEEI